MGRLNPQIQATADYVKEQLMMKSMYCGFPSAVAPNRRGGQQTIPQIQGDRRLKKDGAPTIRVLRLALEVSCGALARAALTLVKAAWPRGES